MAFIHPMSCQSIKSELDLFTLPVTQVSIERSKFIEYRPIASFKKGSALEFLIPGDGDDYLDLSDTLLYIKAKVTKADGKDLEAADAVTPVKNLLHSMISQCDVFLNGKLISSSSDTYPYKAYIETLLN